MAGDPETAPPANCPSCGGFLPWRWTIGPGRDNPAHVVCRKCGRIHQYHRRRR